MRARVPALAVLFALATACQAAPAPALREVVVASDLPTAGSASAISDAIRLAVAQHPLVGPFQVAYLPLNDGPTSLLVPVRGVQNVRQMIADNQVLGAIGPFNSSGALEMIPVANAASFPLVSESVTNWCLTQSHPLCNPQPSALRASGPNTFFRIVAPDPVQGRAIARYMAKTLMARNVAVFTLSDKFDDVTIGEFTKEFARDGGDLVYSANLPGRTDDFGPFLQAARAHGAEAVFAATEQDSCPARAQMKGIFPQGSYFVSMDSAQESGTCIAEAGDNAEGMLATVSLLDMESSHDPAVVQVAKAFRNAYPKSSPIDPYAFAAYDCTLILIGAINRAVEQNGGSFPTRAQVVDEIAHSQLHGAVGTYSFDANGDARSPLMALYQVKGGQWVYEGQIDASATPS